jgi:hypothetical protein
VRRVEGDLDGLALGLGDASPLAALDGPWEMCDGDNEEGIAASKHMSANFVHHRINSCSYI